MAVDIGKPVQFDKLATRKIFEDQFLPVIELSRGKRVLNIGCSGSDAMVNPNPVHKRITASASQCVGIDIFEEGVHALQRQGLDARVGNAETFSLPERDFDVVVLGDVIEHVSNAGLVFDRASEHLRTGGQIIVVTPNPFSLRLMLGMIVGRDYKVNSEHVAWFDPVLLGWLMERSGFAIDELWWFGGSRLPVLKSIIKARPHFHTTFGLLGRKT